MARVVVNSFLRDALGELGYSMPIETCVILPAASMRGLLTAMEGKYPGSSQRLANATVAIDGDIYTDALSEVLNDDSELVFIHPIEGG